MTWVVLFKNRLWYEAISYEDAFANCPPGCTVRAISDSDLKELIEIANVY